MSVFHSTMSRREYMKSLGLFGAGIGGASLVAPVFHDLDELMASESAQIKRAWWIRNTEHPTVDIDWNLMKRHHGFHSTQSGVILARYAGGPAEYQAILAAGDKGVTDGIKNNTPGLTLRDNALGTVARGLGFTAARTDKFADTRLVGVKTPDQFGVPKWQGTPEENFRMMRAAMVFFGASHIGASELDADHKKLVGLYGDNIAESYWPFGSAPKWPPPTTVTQPIEFANQSTFSFDNATGLTKIPSNIPIFSISYTIPQSHELFRTTPSSALFAAANITRYRLRENMRISTQGFVRMLGYQMMYDEPYRGIPSIAGATLTGLVENSRHTIMGISPEHGNTVGLYEVLTDLPIAHTPAIDAGIWRFCQSCGICAKHCPPEAIEKKGESEPSWETRPSAITPKFGQIPGLGFDTEPEFFKAGRKTYWTDMISCQLFARGLPNRCQLCFGVCVFNNQYGAMIHDLVRQTVSVTSMFNGVFATAGETFGYGLKEDEAKEDWWDMVLPAYGYSTGFYSKHGGYNRERPA
ncbi:reductive dehalogenase [Dehalogenimonas alkenigignens]|uniref:Reductive dehalogenase n=1 Tax=Dehalogenimonas alkenigignens TaxID=1217799 RepID=A0A0W0GHE9_9CHLR|nr:reductive dehalogenase [Dehalogenimonas alkenigignens]KTB47980.1 reductive dehalogenase [Dehalogenimonas alkenigignens]